VSVSPEVYERGLGDIFQSVIKNCRSWMLFFSNVHPRARIYTQWGTASMRLHLLAQHWYQVHTTFQFSSADSYQSLSYQCMRVTDRIVSLEPKIEPLSTFVWKSNTICITLSTNEACFPALWVTYASTPACLIVDSHWFVYSWFELFKI
jgi:hypothetical protein